MANKAASSKTRNSDRRNGKAWGKNHSPQVKSLTKEQQERKVHKDAERTKNKKPRKEAGNSYTMPKMTWEWATDSLGGRNNHTRRARIIARAMEQERK